VRIERTVDVHYVRTVIGHPAIKPEVLEGDDEPLVPLHESIYYLVPSVERHADGAIEDVRVGVVAFIPVNSIAWNPHIAILPEHRGCGTEALQAAMSWMFENTPCEKVVAYPPAFNARMIHVFEKCGFCLEGRSPRSFKWRGEYHDRILMGKEK
jgi:RimJ/RimL family protein N-acetyltransferase